MLLQEPEPYCSLLLRAEVRAVSEAMQGCGPGPGGDPVVDDGPWQVAEQVPQDVHSEIVSNGVVLKPTSGADGMTKLIP